MNRILLRTKLTTTFLLTILVGGISFAQNSQHSQHSLVHKDLLANQSRVSKEASLLESLIEDYSLKDDEDFTLSEDLYSNGNNNLVNPYSGQKVEYPDTFAINVSEYVMPTMGYVTSEFGWRERRRRSHYGIDLKVQTGDTIYAAFSGMIRITRYDRYGYGYFVVMRHTNGLETVYGHLSKFLVDTDQIVKAGDPIALGGNTGRSSGSHLHFETRFMGLAINPREIFDFSNKVAHTDTYLFVEKKQKRTSPSSVPGGGTYKIRSGDNLWTISRKHKTSVKQLCAINGIKTTTTLRPGQRLRVR